MTSLEATEIWVALDDQAACADIAATRIASAIVYRGPGRPRVTTRGLPVFLAAETTGSRGDDDRLRARSLRWRLMLPAGEASYRVAATAPPSSIVLEVEAVGQYLRAGAAGVTTVITPDLDLLKAIAAMAPGRLPRIVARVSTLAEAIEAVTLGAEGILVDAALLAELGAASGPRPPAATSRDGRESRARPMPASKSAPAAMPTPASTKLERSGGSPPAESDLPSERPLPLFPVPPDPAVDRPEPRLAASIVGDDPFVSDEVTR